MLNTAGNHTAPLIFLGSFHFVTPLFTKPRFPRILPQFLQWLAGVLLHPVHRNSLHRAPAADGVTLKLNDKGQFWRQATGWAEVLGPSLFGKGPICCQGSALNSNDKVPG